MEVDRHNLDGMSVSPNTQSLKTVIGILYLVPVVILPDAYQVFWDFRAWKYNLDKYISCVVWGKSWIKKIIIPNYYKDNRNLLKPAALKYSNRDEGMISSSISESKSASVKFKTFFFPPSNLGFVTHWRLDLINIDKCSN